MSTSNSRASDAVSVVEEESSNAYDSVLLEL